MPFDLILLFIELAVKEGIFFFFNVSKFVIDNYFRVLFGSTHALVFVFYERRR